MQEKTRGPETARQPKQSTKVLAIGVGLVVVAVLLQSLVWLGGSRGGVAALTDSGQGQGAILTVTVMAFGLLLLGAVLVLVGAAAKGVALGLREQSESLT